MRARSQLVPLCIAPHACVAAPGGGSSGCPGPEGHPLLSLVRIFRVCTQPGTGPVLRHSRHASQHTMSEYGRTPGPSAGPGSFFSHRITGTVFPSFRTPKEFLIRGL